MKLTRVAAQRALDAADDEAQARATNPDPTPDAPNLTQKPRDPNLAFTRVSRIVLQAVTLEAQIAAGAFNRAPTPRTQPNANTPEQDARLQSLCAAVDRDLVVQAIDRLTENHPDRWNLRQAGEDALDDSLADNPEDPPAAHFARICQTLGLTPALENLPDYLAEALRPEPCPIPDD